MIEEMKDGAVAFDASGLVVYCNAYFAQMVKADRASIVGARIFPFYRMTSWDFFAARGRSARRGRTASRSSRSARRTERWFQCWRP